MEINSWVDKYRPTNLNEVIGVQQSIIEIKKWLNNFKNNEISTNNFKNAILISGGTGVGKTLISHLILKEYQFDIIELNSSCLRTSKELGDKIISVFEGKSIKTMFNKSARSSIILDEIDGIDNKKEYTAGDIIKFFNYETDKFYEKKKNKVLKKEKKYLINKNPIICTCNSIDKTLKGILTEVIHIHLNKPSEDEIFTLLKRVNDNENIGLSDIILRLIVPYCQYDFRRTLYIIELVAGFISNKTNHDANEILNFIKKLGNKDVDIGIYEGLDYVFNDYSLTTDKLLDIYLVDINFMPFLIHENFLDFLEKNSNDNYSNKLDTSIKYYDNLIQSQIIKKKTFGNWELLEYIGFFNTVYPNLLLRTSNIKKTLSSNNMSKSALISKYNYRYYNLKYMNQLSKKLNLDIHNFKILSLFVSIAVFIDKSKLNYCIEKLKSIGIESKEFQKIVKLSFIFEKYSKVFTKKLQNSIDSKFNH